jgi:hypothetical protein
MVLGVAVVVLAARVRSPARELDATPPLTEELVGRLTAEVRKWQAESAHWKATAERLQRELDGR